MQILDIWISTTKDKHHTIFIYYLVSMPLFSLFDNTESVFEVIWDVMLVLLVIRVSLVYVTLNLITWVALSHFATKGYFTTTLLTPSESHYVVGSLQLWLIALWAWAIEYHYQIPLVYWFRLAIGALSLFLMAGTELLAAFVQLGRTDAASKTDNIFEAISTKGIMLAAILLMPTALMVLENELNLITIKRRHQKAKGCQQDV